MMDKFKDRDQRWFASREIDQDEAEKARRLLEGQKARLPRKRNPGPDPTPGWYPSREDRQANFERLKKEIGDAVDAKNAARGNGK